jgi:hypothetical protein
MECVVPEAFDAWSWCASDVLQWRAPRPSRLAARDGHARPLDARGAITTDNPPDLVFVMHARCDFLPRELARLHASAYGLGDEECLAPWAIDDATDLLHERRVRPRDVFWLAAPSLPALVWGLHDWVHFHNHGPFDDPPGTELQCDLVALAWLRLNAARVGIGEEVLARVTSELGTLAARRFAEAGRPAPDVARLFATAYR